MTFTNAFSDIGLPSVSMVFPFIIPFAVVLTPTVKPDTSYAVPIVIFPFYYGHMKATRSSFPHELITKSIVWFSFTEALVLNGERDERVVTVLLFFVFA